jgi:hypothetical protein
MGVKKGGHVTKHARGGAVEESPRHEAKESRREEAKEHMKYAKGGVVGGDVKSRSGRDTASGGKSC